MLLPGAGQRADLPGQSESFTAQLSWQQRVPAGPGHSKGQRGRPAVDAASPAQSSSRRAPRAGGRGLPATWWDLPSSSSAGRVEASRDETNAAEWENSPEDCGRSQQLWEGAIRNLDRAGRRPAFYSRINTGSAPRVLPLQLRV